MVLSGIVRQDLPAVFGVLWENSFNAPMGMLVRGTPFEAQASIVVSHAFPGGVWEGVRGLLSNPAPWTFSPVSSLRLLLHASLLVARGHDGDAVYFVGKLGSPEALGPIARALASFGHDVISGTLAVPQG